MGKWTLKDVKQALAVYHLGGSDAIDEALATIANQARIIELMEEELEDEHD